jgi:hypothetical protein
MVIKTNSPKMPPVNSAHSNVETTPLSGWAKLLHHRIPEVNAAARIAQIPAQMKPSLTEVAMYDKPES